MVGRQLQHNESILGVLGLELTQNIEDIARDAFFSGGCIHLKSSSFHSVSVSLLDKYGLGDFPALQIGVSIVDEWREVVMLDGSERAPAVQQLADADAVTLKEHVGAFQRTYSTPEAQLDRFRTLAGCADVDDGASDYDEYATQRPSLFEAGFRGELRSWGDSMDWLTGYGAGQVVSATPSAQTIMSLSDRPQIAARVWRRIREELKNKAQYAYNDPCTRTLRFRSNRGFLKHGVYWPGDGRGILVACG